MTDTRPIVRDTKKKSSPLERFEAQLLLIALKSSEGFDRIQDVVPIQTLTNHKVRTVFNYLKVIYSENQRFNLETAAEVLDFDILTFILYHI